MNPREARKSAQQRGLTAAIRAEQCGDLTTRQRPCFERGQHLPLVVTHAQIVNAQAVHPICPCERTTMPRNSGMPTNAVTIPTGISTPGMISFDAMDASESVS